MAIITNRWTSDACDTRPAPGAQPDACVIEYTWDDSVPEAARVHTQSRVVHMCPKHAGILDGEAYDVVLQENQIKNNALAYLLANAPAAYVTQVLQPDGSTGPEWKPANAPIWNMTGIRKTRKVELTLPGWTTGQKNAIQAAADTRWPNRVTVI